MVAFQAGNTRLSADKYLQAFLNAPSDWAQCRFHILHGYTSILREKYFEPSQRDLDALADIAKDKNEPHLYRSEALWTLGLLNWDKGNRQCSADNYRDAIHLIDTAKPAERKKTTLASIGCLSISMYKVEAILQDNRKSIEENLKVLENQGNKLTKDLNHNVRSDGTSIDPVILTYMVPPDRYELLDRVKVGGDKCDCCGKTLHELGVHKLDTCSRCKLVYYCSVDCGAKAWKAGHKKYCRKKHEIKKGDTMQLLNLKSKPELNGKLVDILGEDPNAESRWVTKLVEADLNPGQSDGTMSIATEKLRHIRPLA